MSHAEGEDLLAHGVEELEPGTEETVATVHQRWTPPATRLGSFVFLAVVFVLSCYWWKSPVSTARVEATISLSGVTWTKNPDKYRGGYANGDSEKLSLIDAKIRCIEHGVKCKGVTCEQDDTQCTVRGGGDLKSSSNHEVTYDPSFPSSDATPGYSWVKFPDKYKPDYANGDSHKRSIADAKKKCIELGDKCKGVTCKEDNTQCTVRGSTKLNHSPGHEITYEPRECVGECEPEEEERCVGPSCSDYQQPEGTSKMPAKRSDCKADREFHCKSDGHGDESGCCRQDSVCVHGGGSLQQCFPLWSLGQARTGHRCDHRGNTQEERDNMCEHYTRCAMKNKDGRNFGCDDYYCCQYPSQEWWDAEAKKPLPECKEKEGWVDKWGDGCDWYAETVQRCGLYGDFGAKDHCCYCQPGPKGGPGANEFCGWSTEYKVSNERELGLWSVELTQDGKTYTKNCEWIEAKFSRCEQWGDVKGKNDMTAKEVCCFCKYGVKVHTNDDDDY